MTHLAVSIMVHDLAQASSAAIRAAEQGADLVEFRIDRFTQDADALIKLIENSPLPCIVTCRPQWEGGDYDGEEQSRIALLAQLHQGLRQPAYIDFELAAYQQSDQARRKINQAVDHPGQVGTTTTGLILSSHDMDGRPVDLYQCIEAMAATRACRVIKIAWMARSLRDNLEAFEIISQRHKPTIALCMGEAGLPSRVLAKKFGALLTFAAIDENSGTAPGQPTVQQIKNLYRWDAVDAETRVYGVIGWPVGHSLSPAIHNAGFDQAAFNGVYLPMPIPPAYEHFKATISSWIDASTLHFRGASVTLPHKENLIRFVEEVGGQVDALAAQIGAANTLTITEDGTLAASNTDSDAALTAVCHAMNITTSQLEGRRVALIGAGGVARAVAVAFARQKATVVVYNRTYDRAIALANSLTGIGGKIVPAKLEKLCDSCCQIYINCTPIGMHPNTNATPIGATKPTKGWGPGTVVFDTIYNPLSTRLLQEAQADGCIVINGVEMFVRQAAAQFALWTGCEAPLDLFRRTITDHLTDTQINGAG